MSLANPVPSAANSEVFDLSMECFAATSGAGLRTGAGCRAGGKICRPFTGD